MTRAMKFDNYMYSKNQHVKVVVYLKNLQAEMVHFNDQ